MQQDPKELSDLRESNLPGMISKNEYSFSNPYDGPDDYNPTEVGGTVNQLSINNPIKGVLSGILGANLYTPTNQYDLRDFALSETGRDQQRALPNAFQSAINNGVNIVKGGGFNIQNTLVGRLIGPNTRLAQIGLAKVAEQMAFNIGDNIRDEIIPAVNLRVNPFNLRDSEFSIESRKAFQITRPAGTLNKIIDTTSRILGLEFPVSPLPANADRETLLENTGKGQIKQLLFNLTENRYAFSREYLTKNPDGVNVIAAYMDERNVATYLYENDNKNNRFLLSPQDDDTLESFTVGFREEKEVLQSAELGFGNQDRINGYFDQDDQTFKKGLTWGDNEENFDIRRGILKYTQNLVASTHPIAKNIEQTSDRENSNEYYQNDEKSYKRFGSRVSRGINNIFHSEEDRRDLIFARSWSIDNQYGDSFKKLVRNGDKERWKYSDGTPYRILNEPYSVITETGLPRIHPVNPSTFANDRNLNFRRLMLSMENLAWKGYDVYLPECEKGTFGGRIMWFPPYDLEYNESVSVQWDKQNFLGRPEAVYTYQGALRSASLSFTLIADYPSVLDYSAQIGDNWKYNSYFQGAYVYDNIQRPGVTNAKKIQALEERIKEIDRELQGLNENVKRREDTNSTPANVEELVADFPKSVSYFFENDVAEYVPNTGSYNSLYDTQSITLESNGTNLFEQGNPSNIIAPANYRTWNGGAGRTITIPAGVTRVWFGNNQGFDSGLQNLLSDASNALESANTKALKVVINAYASNLASDEYNVRLSRARGEAFRTVVESFFSDKTIKPDITFEVIPHGEPNNDFDESGRARTGGNEFVPPNQSFWETIDDSSAREERKVKIEFILDQENIARRNDENEEILVAQNKDNEAIAELERERRILEDELLRLRELINQYCRYFEELKITDPVIYSRYEDRVRFFEPAFHSQTPEDLNTRVTFLHQCTRPGRPLDAQATGNNSLYGVPPVVILRIGDYFHTKIIINSINFSYENASWDYNPEGVGMQPMMAKISITFDIIGGMSLQEPINQLQNALSFNYYANTHVYDDRAANSNPISGFSNSEYVSEVINREFTTQPIKSSQLNQ